MHIVVTDAKTAKRRDSCRHGRRHRRATPVVVIVSITTTGVARPKRARKRTTKAQAMLEAPRDGGAGPATRTKEEEPMLQPAVAQQRAGDVTQTGTPQHAGDTATPITQQPAGETPPAPPLLLPASHTQQGLVMANQALCRMQV